ncbi:hypothetical protein DBY68_018250 [Pseudocitrobacter sp. RIT415]|nr:hypothetical protein DBY68_018250 [Pseudocitrobacter sp. RIT 415]
MVWVLKLGVILELNVVNGMAGSSMPVYGHRLMSVRGLVTRAYAELKRQDGKSDKPGICQLHALYQREVSGRTRFKQRYV